MSIKEERAWAGSQSSYEAALEVEAGIAKLRAGGQYEDEPRDTPRLLSIDGGIATIDIKGPLMNSDSFMLEMFGATGYPEIREALVAAVNDMSVKEIFLDIDSGGGAVSGCGDTADLIRAVNSIKPVTAFTDSVMASAAYWLGSSAGEVYSGRAALVGSIGVKATFREYSEQNKMKGVTVTVIRAGKYKALADQNEKLTPEAEAQIRAVVDATYGVFVEHVAEVRGRPYAYADKTMADGQEFIGQAAVDVGLTDGITTYDAVIGGLRRKILASLPKTMDNHGNNRGSLSGGTSQDKKISGERSMVRRH
jgi:signal peptide peptidase SppA